MNTVLSVLIAGHLVAVEVLAGVLLFLSVVVGPAHAGVPELVLKRRSERVALVCLAVATVTMIGWLWLVAAALAGLRGLPSPEIVFNVLTTTPFGMVWGLRALAVAFAVSALIRGYDQRSGRSQAPLAWSLMVLISLTLASRMATGDHPYAGVLLQMVHLAGSSVWVGGLVALALLAWRMGANDLAAWRKLPIARGRAYFWYFAGSMAAILASGAGMGWLLTGGRFSLGAYFDSVLAVKAGLAVGALAVGGVNRSVLVARLLSGKPRAAAALWIGLALEGVLMVAVIGVSAMLELTPLPIR
ncbi:MAG: CopD family protein [Magnetospirillum sp.]|nr:CopD family protein [Magnetospirillum sp.]